MSPRLIVHPPSKTSSTISHEDDIPPQPLEPHSPNGLGLATSHDPPDLDPPLQSPDTIGPNSQRKEAIAFHRLPIDILERYVGALGSPVAQLTAPQNFMDGGCRRLRFTVDIES
jgi:hypothetical protein